MTKTKSILISGVIAGTLDAIAAVLLYAKPVNLHNISNIFRYIASGLFGKTAYYTGPFYPFSGLVLHYLIAAIWAAIYILILSKFFNKPGSVWLKTFLFGSLIWVIMNGFVMPVAGLSARYNGWAIMRSSAVILVCIALPIILIAEKRA
jgi:uncharacterized membrane protein YagU involved in acid resistance